MTRLLLLLSGALAVVIAAEISPWQRTADEFGPAAAVRPSAASARDRSRRAGSDMVHWVAVILARPLFAPDRRPAHDAPSAAAAAGVPRLSGIIVAPGEAAAIFRQHEGAKPLVARPGDLVGGWVLSTISANRVNLRKADARITLTPEFDGAADSPAPGVAYQTVSRWLVAPPTGLLRARWSNPQLQP